MSSMWVVEVDVASDAPSQFPCWAILQLRLKVHVGYDAQEQVQGRTAHKLAKSDLA